MAPDNSHAVVQIDRRRQARSARHRQEWPMVTLLLSVSGSQPNNPAQRP